MRRRTGNNQLAARRADPHHFNAHPDLAFHFTADPDPDPAPHVSNVNPRPLVYRPSRDPFKTSALQFYSSMAFHSSIFESLAHLNFGCNADPYPTFPSLAAPDPAFHSNADRGPDPASKINADLDPQPSLQIEPDTYTAVWDNFLSEEKNR